MSLMDLHTAGREEVHCSPWRDDPRPMEGILHAVYSYVGVTDYWDAQRRVLSGPSRARAEFEFVRWSHQVGYGLRTLAESGTLTPLGSRFVAELAITAAGWAPDQGLADVNRLAELTIADHRLRWRLRHRRPDAAAVDALAEAFQAGAACPRDPLTVPGAIRPGRRDLPLSPRLSLIGLRLRDPERYARLCRDDSRLEGVSPSLSAADTALLDGDAKTALPLYFSRIAERPDDIEQWAGLALALGFAAPEVLSALHVRTGAAAEKLVAWLAPPPLQVG